ncbi:conserved unknown protein [Ectocarpus siliculosus]|uniref:F-box domain-containing protein n=1 Tax=Ectocarpus siliculosus TaxID=2880 RepID=D8LI95_ECTSI|nr:conserved unknown protein [Ectocarpus siliculosus]|eukprot:CBN75917.1 conserved unknown protein [Ectocarpus siliculosus]
MTRVVGGCRRSVLNMRSGTRRATGQLAGLPRELLARSMELLNMVDLGQVCCVNKDWRNAAEEDAVWRFWWARRFREDPPPQRGRARAGHLKQLHRYRLEDPLVGDKVEVSWEGRFRLESLDVFVGRSWWEATVVQKMDGFKYKIHYPGWDSNWDEWVVRDRLRWPVDPSYLSTTFRVREVVEVWCTGTHVKGAWLQARVRQIKQDQVSLKNVLASSPRTVWVPRSKVRRVCTGASCVNSSSRNGSRRRGGGRSSKLDASRQEALARALRGLSAGARRLPRAGLAGLRGAVRRRASLSRMRRGGGGGGGGGIV